MDARRWFNCVEEMVFSDDDFCKDIDPPSDDDISNPVSTIENRQKLQALQAAYIVCLYQNWEGADPSKRRIRRHRFSTVVSVSNPLLEMAASVAVSLARLSVWLTYQPPRVQTARDLGINTARHLDYFRQSEVEFNWCEYVVREEIVRSVSSDVMPLPLPLTAFDNHMISIYMWIFLLDTAFVIFNNLPHRMVIKEMKMHMVSPEACFQAETSAECFAEIRRWMSPESPFCSLLLRDAIENLCLDTMTDETHQRLSQLGPTNLFAMVSGESLLLIDRNRAAAVQSGAVLSSERG